MKTFSLSPQQQQALTAKGIDFGKFTDFLNKIIAGAPKFAEAVKTIAAIIAMVLGDQQPAMKGTPATSFTCPADHSVCCHAVLEAALQTAALAAQACCHCDDGCC